MADPILEALQAKQRKTMLRNPFLLGGSAAITDKTQLEDPNLNAYMGLAKALGGGLALGFGLRQSENQVAQQQKELANIVRQHGSNPDSLTQALMQSEHWKDTAGINAWQMNEEQRKAQQAHDQALSLHKAKATDTDIRVADYQDSLRKQGMFWNPNEGRVMPVPGYAEAAFAATPEGRHAARSAQSGQVDPQIGQFLDQGYSHAVSEKRAMELKGFTPKQEEDQIRKDISASKTYKDFHDVGPQVDTINRAMGLATRASDISLIAAFARINDPGSTVREGEVHLSAQAAPWLTGMLQKARSEMTSGGEGLLTPKTRQQILEMSQAKVDAFQDAYNDIARHHVEIAQRRHGDAVDPLNMIPIPVRTARPSPAQFTIEKYGNREMALSAYQEALTRYDEGEYKYFEK